MPPRRSQHVRRYGLEPDCIALLAQKKARPKQLDLVFRRIPNTQQLGWIWFCLTVGTKPVAGIEQAPKLFANLAW